MVFLKCKGSAMADYVLATSILVMGIAVVLFALDIPFKIGDYFSHTVGGEVQGNTVVVKSFGQDLEEEPTTAHSGR